MAIPINISRLTPSREAEWNNFVAASNNGTVFHRTDFLAYHPENRFSFHHLIFEQDGAIVALLPGSLHNATFKSPAGASLGGFVTLGDISLECMDNCVKALIEYCRTQSVQDIFITPPMTIYHTITDESVDYALLYNGFCQHNPLYSSAIDLRQIKSKEDLTRNTRHKINKAINKNIRIVEANDFDVFYPILLENKAKFDVKPTHTLDELYKINTLLPGMMTLFMAYLDDVPIAGELLFAANKNCILNFYTMHKYEFRNFFSVNYLVEHAIRWSVARGFKWYDYGVSQDTAHTNPMTPSYPLITFKESMGARGCIRRAYHKNLSA
jgi:lipid II:glycine glycyltransferase (peptidoglycan interpeptide bridge formation enzyme)